MSDIKAIETEYNGYRFRSRLEARWAVFFDSVGIEYVYKPEKIRLVNDYYQFDFYLPESKQLFEVQGVFVNTEEENLQRALTEGYSVTIGTYDGKFITCDHWPDEEIYGTPFSFDTSNDGWLCRCRSCGKYWFMGSHGVWDCQCCGEYDGDGHFTVEMSYCDYVVPGHGRCEGGDLRLWDFAKYYRFHNGYNKKVERQW